MDSFAAIHSFGDAVLVLGLSTTRLAVAFLLVPLFSAQLIPALIRNALFVSIALLNLALTPPSGELVATGFVLVALFAKEAFIGGVMGFIFASMLWAFEAAGQLIDTKVGTTQAQISDPLSGHQTTLNGALFGRLASFLFMAGGGFMVMIGALMESFALWPVGAPWPALDPAGIGLLESEFGRIMFLAVLISAPALVLLYLVETVLGLMNRFAPQLNVFSLSLSLKAVAATWIVMLQLIVLAQLLQDELMSRGEVVLNSLRALLSG